MNNDMDEFFRRAAENYPLDTSSKDWNRVAAALEDKSEEQKPASKNNYRRFTWLLLLVPLYFICNRPVTPGINDGMNKGTSTEQTKNAGIESPIRSQENTKRAEDHGIGTSSSLVSNEIRGQQPGNQPSEEFTGSRQAPNQSIPSSLQNEVLGPGKNRGHVNQADINIKQPSSTTDGMSSLTGHGKNIEINSPGLLRSSYTRNISRDHIESNKEERSFSRNDITSPSPLKTKPPVKQQRFYLGLMAGIDVTTIKMQKTKEAGYDYGAVVGYDLSRKWSIEAGVFMDQKSYYSDGKYLTTDKVYRPANSEITDITGTCRMFDLSLGGKYTIRRNAQSSFFAAAGISSYLMKTEDYSYTYYYPQTGIVYVHDKTYKNETRNILSIANVSVGFTQKIGKFADLRIEPYVKIPLRGVGYGELPLMSAGLRAGFVRKIF